MPEFKSRNGGKPNYRLATEPWCTCKHCAHFVVSPMNGKCSRCDRHARATCGRKVCDDFREKNASLLDAAKQEFRKRRNCERFDSWWDAYIAWVRETQECAEHPIDWGELPDDAYEAAEELWMHYFADDQNREFCDWLWTWEESK